MAVLSVVPAEGDPFDHPLERDSLTIGRSSQCDLVLADVAASRRHARLVLEGEDWFLEDLLSRHGTLLNGEPVARPTRLRHGDRIQVAGTTITFRDGRDEAVRDESEVTPIEVESLFRPADQLLRQSQTPPPPTSGVHAARTLQRYAERLQILNSVHQALGRSVSLEELLDLILDSVFHLLRPQQGALFLRRPGGEEYYRAASRAEPGLEKDLVTSRSLVREVAEKGLAALVVDTVADPRFAGAQSLVDAGVRSLVAAPLLDPKGSLGMIVLSSNRIVRSFTEEDLELLVSLASVAALRITNLSLAEEAAERRRLAQELLLARRIQVALLPGQLPQVEGYEIHGGNVPTRAVSGDLYEVLQRHEGREVALVLADVSGKGIGAALLTASLEALLSVPIESELAPDVALGRVSRLLFQRTAPEQYATAFLGILRPESGSVLFASAGHTPALVLRRDGSCEWLGATGVPLGLFPESRYGKSAAALGPGEMLVIYSDGVSEVLDPEWETFGRERLAEVCARHRREPLAALAATLEWALEEFARGRPFLDDRTLLMVRRGER